MDPPESSSGGLRYLLLLEVAGAAVFPTLGDRGATEFLDQVGAGLEVGN